MPGYCSGPGLGVDGKIIKIRPLLLTETYEVKIDRLTVLSISSGIPADEGIAVLILHYLMGMQKQQGFSPSGEWISSKEV